MIYDKQQVFAICDQTAPKYNFEPSLIKALCMQECEHRVIGKDGKLHFDPNAFRADKVRLEQNYYDRYVERQNEYASTTEGLLAMSWGITQMMGLSLKELKYFEWWFDQQTPEMKTFLGNAYSETAVPKALNWFCVNLDAQVEWGCKWLSKKRNIAKSDIIMTLSYWNGDRTPEHKYANEVLSKQKSVISG
jgi:hypothetical protein